MSKVKIKLNREGVKELLRGQDMQNATEGLARDIISRAGGEGYESNTFVGKNRCNTSVIATSYEAIRDNNRNNTLLKSLR